MMNCEVSMIVADTCRTRISCKTDRYRYSTGVWPGKYGWINWLHPMTQLLRHGVQVLSGKAYPLHGMKLFKPHAAQRLVATYKVVIKRRAGVKNEQSNKHFGANAMWHPR